MELDIISNPGLLTDQESKSDGGRQDPTWLKAHGYKWLSYQVYNPVEGGNKNRNLQPAKKAGMNAGVWGAFFDRANFFADGSAFGQQAVKMGAEHVIVDAEDCSKFTRADRACRPIIRGLRAGGWTGPVHLTQMGAPSNPKTVSNPRGNDYQCDEASFLETGGGILPQEYANESSEYEPVICRAYWLACGVPDNRLNHMIAVYTGRAGRIDGKTWAQKLEQAGVGCNFSVYMVEMLEPYDAEGLDTQTQFLPPPPPPPAIPDPTLTKVEASVILHKWLDYYMKQKPSKPQSLTIIRLADRLLKLEGQQRADFDEALLKKELDRVGSPPT